MKRILFFISTKSYGVYINLLCFVVPKKATLLAFSIFSNPRKGKLNDNQLPPFLAEAQKETFDNYGLPFQTYRWEGDEKIIFLLHGWESNTARWEKLIPYLTATGHTIIAIDAPAHGLSRGKECSIISYVTSIYSVSKKYSPNYIIGHSIGGKASLYYRATYNNPSVEKMVLLGAPPDYSIIFKNYVCLVRLNSRIEKLIHQYYWERFQIKVADFRHNIMCILLQLKGFYFMT